jgi:hypothetical protein
MFSLRKALMGIEFVWLILLLVSQFFPYIVVSSSYGSTLASSEFTGEAVIDGISYHILQGDFHMHTGFSDGTETPFEMVKASREFGYDFIAITDHGHIQGAINAKVEVEKYGMHLIVIIGEEIGAFAIGGHVLALHINQVIPDNILSHNEICKRIHDQGGYAVLAHPSGRIEAVTKSLIESHQIDAYEAYNDRGNYTPSVVKATPVAAQYPSIGVSDAHNIDRLGFTKTIVFSVNRTVNGIFDAILDHRRVIKFGGTFVGNKTLVNIVEEFSKMFEAKAAIGSAEVSIVRAKNTIYLSKPDLDGAEELLEESLNYYRAKDYDNAVAAAQQVKGILKEGVNIWDVIIIVLPVTIAVIAVAIYHKRRSQRAKSRYLKLIRFHSLLSSHKLLEG